jgi:hypothetical protein
MWLLLEVTLKIMNVAIIVWHRRAVKYVITMITASDNDECFTLNRVAHVYMITYALFSLIALFF